jgi:hypothetical protein
MELAPLYMLTGDSVREDLGKIEDGTRIKIEFRGKSTPESPIACKAHGTDWILEGPLGPGATSAVQEIITPALERVVLELQGYTIATAGNGIEIRTSGIIRTSSATYADLNGRIAVVIQRLSKDGAIAVDAYKL